MNRQCLAFSLPLLPEWWWCIPDSIPYHGVTRRNAGIFCGTCGWTVQRPRAY